MAATRYDNDDDGEDRTVTMKVKAVRKTKHQHSEDVGDRKEEEDEDDEGGDEEDDEDEERRRRNTKNTRRH